MSLALFFAIFVTLSYAQTVPENVTGCCFYAEKNLEKPIGCSTETFSLSSAVQSWFCTAGFAGFARKSGTVVAAVTCADTMLATMSPVDADEFQIVTPCPTLLNGASDCCFYTEENQQGEEVCLPAAEGAAAPQSTKDFKSYQCFPRMRPKVNGRAAITCPRPAVGDKFDTPAKLADISTESCGETAPRAESSDENFATFAEVDINTLGDLAATEVDINTLGDLATADDIDFAASESLDNTFNDDYSGDLAETDYVETFNSHLQEYDSNFAETDFVETFNDDYSGDLAETDNVETFNEYDSDFAETDYVETFSEYDSDLAASDDVETFNEYDSDFAETDFVETFNDDYSGDLAETDNVETFNEYDSDFAETDYVDTFNEYDSDLAASDDVDSFADIDDGAAAGVMDSVVQKAGAGQMVCTLALLLVGLVFFL